MDAAKKNVETHINVPALLKDFAESLKRNSDESLFVQFGQLVPVALKIAEAVEQVGTGLQGPQKLRVVQLILLDAIGTLNLPEEKAKNVRTFIHETLPWAITAAVHVSKVPHLLRPLKKICFCF